MNIDELQNALSAITPRPAPVDAVIRRGKRIRWQRRGVAAATLAAAVAAAVIIPHGFHVKAAPAPPATGHITVQPPGPRAPADEIAEGTIDGRRWDLRWERPCAGSSDPAGCVVPGGTDFGPGYGAESTSPQRPGQGVPVTFGSVGTPPDQFEYGAVRADVAYLTVMLGDGSTLTLRPVKVHGVRVVGFGAPDGMQMTIAAYARPGEIARTFPLVVSGQPPIFGTGIWYAPGQPVPPRISGVVGSGKESGGPWTATAYLGPWGTCVVITNGGNVCGDGNATTGPEFTGMAGEPVLGTADRRVTRLTFTFPGHTLTVPAVEVGGQKFFAFTAPGDPNKMHWTAYDARGSVVARG